MGIRIVLFDLDDTLLDTSSAVRVALDATCAVALERCPGLTEEQIRHAYHAVTRAQSREREAGLLSSAALRDLDLYRWKEILARCRVESTHADLLADHYLACRFQHYQLFPEVPELLPQLLRSYRLALLTNGPGELQRRKIAVAALERWVPMAYVSGEIGIRKPHEGIFRHALAQLECEPEEAVMVGDSLHHDIAGAAALGMRTVWINRHGQEPEAGIAPDAVIEDLRPLPGLLDQWR